MTAVPTQFSMMSLLASGEATQRCAITSEMTPIVSGEFVIASVAQETPAPVAAFDDEVTTVYTPPTDEVTTIYTDPLPASVAYELVDGMSGVSLQDTDRLRGWMRERGLRATLWTNAAQYYSSMIREDRAFQRARPRAYGVPYNITLFEGEKGLFWIGANSAESRIFLTQGGRTREIPYGRPLRIHPGNVVTCGDRYMKLVNDYRGAHFYRADGPADI